MKKKTYRKKASTRKGSKRRTKAQSKGFHGWWKQMTKI